MGTIPIHQPDIQVNYDISIYFTSLNLAAIKGDDVPYSNDSRVREDREVVIIYPESCIHG